jgi:hypothetical protein
MFSYEKILTGTLLRKLMKIVEKIRKLFLKKEKSKNKKTNWKKSQDLHLFPRFPKFIRDFMMKN